MNKQQASATRLSAQNQPKDRLYEMSLRFICDAVPKDIADMLDFCGMQETPVIKNALTLRITQTINFIPDDNVIAAYMEMLTAENNNSNKNTKITNIRFDGYDYIYAVASDS